MSDSHTSLVAAGYLRRGVDPAAITRRTGLSYAEIVAIAKRLRIADEAAARTAP